MPPDPLAARAFGARFFTLNILTQRTPSMKPSYGPDWADTGYGFSFWFASQVLIAYDCFKLL